MKLIIFKIRTSKNIKQAHSTKNGPKLFLKLFKIGFNRDP
jgi:hypothetical protein